MTKLLSDITEIITGFLKIAIEPIINADLGPLGMIGVTITIIGLAITIVKRIIR